ncbi:c-type cytochrome [Hyphomicrobium sp. ghe19]|uniref:c-type cytochrome n=1 Tax=Hyphomicrobium sp. ghe19 TaxID=2682968 RepID=UPI00136733AF|nr:Cbb3-type cytochrome c oxidase subunit FixP [Hyphomicrobium sp. ghe19]
MNKTIAPVVAAGAMALFAIQIGLATAADEKAPKAQSGTSENIPPAIRYESHIAAGGAPPVGGKLVNPFSGNSKVAAAGEQMFSAMNCDGCHGGGATGFAAPSLADGRWRYGGEEDELFQTIYFGRPKGMPAFGGLMSADDVWTVVTYLKSLPVPDDEPTESWVGK